MVLTLRQFVKEYKNTILQHGGQKALQLGKGQCADFAEYKKGTGYIAGIEAAAELAEQLLRQIEEADEQQDLPEMTPTRKSPVKGVPSD